MNIKDFQDSLEYLFKAELTGFVWGHAGIGKSSVIKQYAQGKGWHFFPLYLGTQSDLGDVLGLADFVRDERGTAVATTFATPIWLKNAIDYCNNHPDSGAIIFLDEFNRARRDVLNGMFSLALDKTFHTIKLPKNCHIIAAGNPPTEEYFTTDVNETALMARFVHIKLEPTIEEWVTYASDAKFDPTIVSFIKEQPKLLEDAKSHFDLPVKVDRRSFERLNRLFRVDTPKYLFDQLASGIIGIERLVAYNLHQGRQSKPLTTEEVLGGQRLEEVRSWSQAGDTKSSLLIATTDNLQASINSMSDAKTLLSEQEKLNLLNFLLVVPKEVMFVFLEKCMNKKKFTMDNFTSDKKVIDTLTPIVKSLTGDKK